MWWPRWPTWKRKFLTNFILLLYVFIATTNSVMADEGQHCGGSNMSAVVWITVFCTMLLILLVIGIYFVYFVYCKRREHTWSSLWWKNNTDKNLVLQTMPPSKTQRQKSGTDNPAFSTDINNGDYIIGTGITKVVRVPPSTINDGSLRNQLLMKEESNRRIYLFKYNDGSKGRLVALRLVFDKEQQAGNQASDLSQTLVELSHKYGLQVELEVEGSEDNVALTTIEKSSDETMTKCVKTNNILSAVCEKAHRLWNQRHFFKKDENGAHIVDADKENGTDDAEKGIGVSADGAPGQKKLSLCSATTVDETIKTVQDSGRHRGGSLRYHTLEYGASPADAIVYSSPDDNVQCCTMNANDVPVKPVRAAEPVKDDKDTVAITMAAPMTIEGQTKQAHPKNDETTKTSVANPPPPPPRKYSASVVSSACAPATTAASLTNNASVSEIIPSPTPNTSVAAIIVPHHVVLNDAPLPIACSTPDNKEPRAPQQATTTNEIRVDDDYYWCTTTAMVMPSMSTFGKQQSSAGKDTSDVNDTVAANDATVDDGDSGNVIMVAAAASGTASIEDASLPSLSSDEEDDDNDDVDGEVVFAVKKTTKLECPTPTIVDANGTFDGKSSENDRTDDRVTSASVAIKAKPRNDNIVQVAAVSSPSESKLTTRLPTLKSSLSCPPMTNSGTASSLCCPSPSSSASSTTSNTSSSSSSSPSPTNNGGGNSTIVSKIPVRRQSAGSNIGGGTTFSTSIITNGTAKRSIPLPLSRSSSRLAM